MKDTERNALLAVASRLDKQKIRAVQTERRAALRASFKQARHEMTAQRRAAWEVALAQSRQFKAAHKSLGIEEKAAIAESNKGVVNEFAEKRTVLADAATLAIAIASEDRVAT